MLRSVAFRLHGAVRSGVLQAAVRSPVAVQQRLSHGKPELSEDEFDQKYVDFFNRPNLDGWECRKAMNDLAQYDLVPEPKIIVSALKACRRLNDFAMAVRFLESVKDKCGPKVNEIYPWIIQEIRPTLDELGINTPEELGYDKPELAIENVDEIH
uniref:Cytochrome c oxidase subunit 5A, mitochondrial n=1 Tax=Anthurium amnicola TaxID=1678845 RepID=A0A1D1YVT6_9ARAE